MINFKRGLERTWLPYLLFSILSAFWIVASSATCMAVASDEADPTPEAIGKPGSVHVSTAMGSVIDSIPITVSPGRRKMEPKIVLSYSSSGGQGILGLGWQMDFGRVEKWRGEGVPAPNITNSFAYSLVGAGGELVDTGDGIYRAKIERVYRVFVKNGDGWEMYNGEGAIHRFGSSLQSRVYNQRWLLDQVEDAHGNTINYLYEKKNIDNVYGKNLTGMVYPVEIRYTGYAPDNDPGVHRVVFEYEERPDIRIFYSGFVDEGGVTVGEVFTHRLKGISVYADGDLTRRYEFEYTQHELNGQSMLTRVILVGLDNTSKITLRTIRYGTRTLGWDDGSAPNDLPVDIADGKGLDTGSRIIDVNGDNLGDVVDGVEDEVWLGDGRGGFSYDPGWSASFATATVDFIDDKGADKGVRLIDVNSDGLPDLFIAMPGRSEILLNNGLGWTSNEKWTESLRLLNGPVEIDPNFPGDTSNCTPPRCDGEWGEFDGCTQTCTGSDDDPDDCSPPVCPASAADRYAVEDFVTRFYNLCLNRDPDPDGLKSWVDSLVDGSKTGSDVAMGFVYSPEFIEKGTNDEEYLQILYKAFFNRQPDSGGWKTWTNDLAAGKSREHVLNGFIFADEFKKLCNAYGIKAFEGHVTKGQRGAVAAFVTRFYELCLGRKPDPNGLATWTDNLIRKIQTGAEVANGFVFSKEFIEKKIPNSEFLEILYEAFFDRAPDKGGWDMWLKALNEGRRRQEVLNGFIYSQEFAELCERFGIKVYETMPLPSDNTRFYGSYLMIPKVGSYPMETDNLTFGDEFGEQFGNNYPYLPAFGSSLSYSGDENEDGLPESCLPECDENGLPEGCLLPECDNKPVYEPGSQPLTLVGDQGDSQGVKLADVNGDGRVDVIWSMSSSEGLYYKAGRTPIRVRAVYLNTGNGWIRNDVLSKALLPYEFVTNSHINGYEMLDVNGDGLADIIQTREDEESDDRAVYLGTGRGWTENKGYTSSLIDHGIVSLKYVDTNEGVKAQSQGLTPTDLNEDGLLDYVIANESETRAFRNTGRGWEEDPALADLFLAHGIVFVENEGTESAGVVFANINGDGLMDIVDAKDGVRRIHYSSGLRSGLMAETTSALGQIATVQWAMSASLNNLCADGIEHLPINMPVVRSLTLNYGLDDIYTTGFHYGGGLFENRQFRGFRQSIETQPSGLEIHTKHYQTEELAGQVMSMLMYDSEGELRERHLSEYSIVATEGQVPMILPGSEKEQISGGDIAVQSSPVKQILPILTIQELVEAGQTRRTTIKYKYNERMNPVAIFKDPEDGVSNDETTMKLSWVVNEAAGIWSLPFKTTTLGPQNQVMAETIFIYDDLPEGQVARGLASRVRDFVEGDKYVERIMEHDRYGNVIAYRDRAGGWHEFEYDATSTFRTYAADPEGREAFGEYDLRFGLEVRTTNASGNQTTRTYDPFGRLAKIVLPGDEGVANGTRSYSYSPLGNPGEQYFILSETQSPDSPEILNTKQFFNSMEKVYRVERKDGNGRTVVTMNEYDDKGNPLKVNLPFYEGDEPRTSVIIRDELRRPVRIVDSDGYETNLIYAGSRVDHIDRGGETVSYWRNVDGKITKITRWVDGKEQTTHYTYDVLGRLTKIIDALGEVTIISYDALGRRIQLDDPNTGKYVYHYDPAGRLLHQESPGNETTTFNYNRAGDLLEKIFPDGSVVKYIYGEPGDPNAVGLPIQVEDAAGVVEMKYDARGNLIERERTVMGTRFLTGYAYDSMKRLRRVTYPDGYVVNYDYDKLSNIDRLIDGEGRQIASELKYNASGQLLNITYNNGISSSFSYGEMTQMNAIETRTQVGDTLQDLIYHYDSQGNIIAIDDNVLWQSQTFDYDEAGRLTRANGIYGERVYEYDVIGNLLRKGDMTFEMDPLHPQRVVKAQYLDAKGADKKSEFAVQYDLRGNVTVKSDRRYEYSSENHMVRMFNSTGKVLEENFYDASGQRVIQRTRNEETIFIDGIYERGKTHDSRHIYAGPLLVSTIVTPRAQVKLANEIEPSFLGLAKSGLGHGWAAFARRHTAALGMGATVGAFLVSFLLIPISTLRRVREEVDETGQQAKARPFLTVFIVLLIPVFILVHTVQASAGLVTGAAVDSTPNLTKRFYYHSNHLGNVNVVTDQYGKVVEKRDYTPYGEPVEWAGPNSGPRELLLTFNGHRYDDNSGLYYFGARYYDPELGRFLTADTIVPDPMNPKTLNRYAFGNGNPIRYSDPTGHAAFDIVFAVLVGIAAVVLGALAVVVTAVSWGTLGWAGAILAGVAFFLGGVAVGLATALGFGIWYVATAGEDLSFEGFRRALFSGFLLGTVVYIGLAVLVLSFIVPGVPVLTNLIAQWVVNALVGAVWGALMGAGMGALTSAIGHFISGGSPDGLFWPLISGIAWGAGLGAAGGAITGALTSNVSWVLDLGKKGLEAWGWIAGLGGAALDVTDSVFSFVGRKHSLGGLVQNMLCLGLALTIITSSRILKYDSSFMSSEMYREFFGGTEWL